MPNDETSRHTGKSVPSAGETTTSVHPAIHVDPYRAVAMPTVAGRGAPRSTPAPPFRARSPAAPPLAALNHLLRVARNLWHVEGRGELTHPPPPAARVELRVASNTDSTPAKSRVAVRNTLHHDEIFRRRQWKRETARAPSTPTDRFPFESKISSSETPIDHARRVPQKANSRPPCESQAISQPRLETKARGYAEKMLPLIFIENYDGLDILGYPRPCQHRRGHRYARGAPHLPCSLASAARRPSQ